MSAIKTQEVEETVNKLMQSSEDQLYEDLGVRVKAFATNGAATASFSSTPTYDAKQMGLRDDLRAFGKAWFKGIMTSAHELICGDSPDWKEDRDKIKSTFGLGTTAVTTAIACALATNAIIPAAIAAVVATLIVKIFFKSAYDAFCANWKQKLG
jgi:hypothetical protein